MYKHINMYICMRAHTPMNTNTYTQTIQVHPPRHTSTHAPILVFSAVLCLGLERANYISQDPLQPTPVTSVWERKKAISPSFPTSYHQLYLGTSFILFSPANQTAESHQSGCLTLEVVSPHSPFLIAFNKATASVGFPVFLGSSSSSSSR